jgi:H+/Cl- antiporter ClcA
MKAVLNKESYFERTRLKERVKFLLLICLSGLLAAIVSSLFLRALDWATNVRVGSPHWIWMLPVLGWIIGLADHRWAGRSLKGNNLILDEIHDPQGPFEKLWVPFNFVGSVLSHLCGASVGREGALVQMASAASDHVAQIFKITPDQRRVLLICAMSAGFGSAVGAPWAGVLFGMEVLQVGRMDWSPFLYCLVASLSALGMSSFLGITHAFFPEVSLEAFVGWRVMLWILVASAVFGLFAMMFVRTTHSLQALLQSYLPCRPWRGLWGGLLLALFLHRESFASYQGLGLEGIQWALVRISVWEDAFLKAIFTSLSIAFGFKGGEFTPLVWMGANLGSFVAGFVDAPVTLFAALGFVAVFAAASNTPYTCAFMAAELFGWRLLPYALLSCLVAAFFSGHRGLYSSQIIHQSNYWLWDSFRSRKL